MRSGTRTTDKRILLAVTVTSTANSLLQPVTQALADAGWDVHVVCSPGQLSDQILSGPAQVHFIRMRRSISPLHDIASLSKMRSTIRRIKPNVVVGSTPKAALLSMFAARSIGVKTRVLQLRGARWDGMAGPRRRLLVAADRLAVRSATHILSVSDSLADLALDSRITNSRPVVLGRGGSKGVDRSMFYPDPAYTFDAKRPRLGFAGRLSKDKGIDSLLAVHSSLLETHPGAILEIVGEIDPVQPIDSVLMNRLMSTPQIILRGRLTPDELAKRMRQWDVLVFPSIREGLPNVVIEAAACGVPTVGWDATGVRDAVDSGKSGELVPIGSIRDLLAALACTLDDEEHRIRRHGALSLADQFDSQTVMQQFVEFMIGCSHGPPQLQQRDHGSEIGEN